MIQCLIMKMKTFISRSPLGCPFNELLGLGLIIKIILIKNIFHHHNHCYYDKVMIWL